MSAFVSHDGDGTEVYVSTARGKITKIEERTSSANVTIEASYLDYPLNGWLNIGEEALEIIRKAHENGDEIEVRLEAQRKPKVDKSLPIQEIRESKTAKTDIIKKIASVNGVFTSEALTNPEDDPDTGKAKSALNRPSGSQPATAAGNASNGAPAAAPTANKETVLVTLRNLATNREVGENVLDALKAQALLSGATIQEVVEATTIGGDDTPQQQNGFSREAPAFKEYNSDGRLNLGGPGVASGVGVYNYVFEKLQRNLNAEPNKDTVEFLSALVLSMADVIQTGVYGQGFRVDRTAGSHTRARACLFSIIDLKGFPITETGELDNAERVNGWVRMVGASARSHFISGITLSQQFPTVKNMLSFVSEDGGIKEPTPAVAEQPSERPAEQPRERVAEATANTAEAHTATPEPVTEPTVDALVDTPSPEVAEPVKTETATPAAEEFAVNHADDGVIRFDQKLLPPGAINSNNAPSEELLTQFKEFVIDEVGLKTKEEQIKVGKLLSATFGRAYNKASNIPEDDLADFLDFYVSTGSENFKAALDSL